MPQLSATIGGGLESPRCAPRRPLRAPPPSSFPSPPPPLTPPPPVPAQTLVPYVPTAHGVVDRMLVLAGVTKDDVVFDLGSGDGRIPITAAKTYGAKGVGLDIDPDRIKESWVNAKAAGVERLVDFREQDVLKADISE